MNCRERHYFEKDFPLSFTAISQVEAYSEYGGNNAFNYNGTNGNMNANNKNNANNVRPVSEFLKMSIMVRLRDIYDAYWACKRNKMNAASTIEFDINYRENLQSLWRDINKRLYTPSRSIAFLVYKPRLREIFAANYRDRIVHHYIDLRLRPLIEECLIEKTCNNRIGKGTHAAIDYLNNDIIAVTEGYQKTAYVCKMDMKGFFMSITKSLVRDQAIKFVQEKYFGDDKEDLIYLLDMCLMNHPEKNCILKTRWSEWKNIPKNKSLFTVDPDRGLTIGDLLSQLMANFFLNEFDHYVSEIGVRYGRYVDDFYIVDTDKNKILSLVPSFREHLASIGVTLHPDKFYIQECGKGVEFVGKVIKPGRIYVHNRTVNNAFRAIQALNEIEPNVSSMERFMCVVNSYLWHMGNFATFNIRKRLVETINGKWWEYFDVNDDLKKVILKKQFSRIEITKRKITNNRRRRKYVSRRNKQEMAANPRIKIVAQAN